MDTPNLKTAEGRKQLTAMCEKDKSPSGQKMMELVKEYEAAKGLLGPLKRFMLNNKFEKAWKEVLNSAQKPQAETLGGKRTSEYGSISQALAGQVTEQIYGPAPKMENDKSIYASFPSVPSNLDEVYSNVGLVQKPTRTHEYGSASNLGANPSSIYASFPSPTNEYGPAPSSVNSKSEYGPASFLPQTTNEYGKAPNPNSIYSSFPSASTGEYGSAPRPAPATPPEFFAAVREGNTDKVKGMLDNHPALINVKDEKGNTALQVAKQSGNADLEKYIKGQGKFAQMAARKQSSGSLHK